MKIKPLLIPCASVGLVCLFSYFYLDRYIAFYFRSLDPGAFALFSLITQLGNSKWYLIPTALMFIIFRFIHINMKLAYRSLLIFLVISISGLLTDILKYVVARYRPIALFEDGLYGFDFFQFQYRMTSFPSGHANTITALMLAMYFMFPKYKIVYLAIALLVIASRVVLCHHFLSDVLFGACLAGVTTFYLMDCFMRKHSEIFALKKPDDLEASSMLSG
jgi:membrane-associated phospholipid phosphatase